MDMSKLRPGQSGTVLKIVKDTGRRLQDLGLIKGSVVKCLFRSPLGDPTAYLVCGTTVALRSEDAALVKLDAVWD